MMHQLPLKDGLVYPDYNGRSILNIPSSLCHWFAVPGLGAGALDQSILARLGERYRHVILVLMDALALHRLQRWMQQGALPVWSELAARGFLEPLTSVSPSTTSSALTTLWTGRSPTEHAITGYEMWMKEYGIVANTVLHMPITFKSDLGALERAGFDPEKFLPFLTLGTHLKSHGVQAYGLQQHAIAHSGLSRMLLKDVEMNAFSTPADLWINLRHLLEQKASERLYAWVYWGELDFISHFYGPDDERSAAEFALFSQAMQSLFLDRLSAAARQDTLLILTADHGMITTRKDERYNLRNHPAFLSHLHITPTGENRLAYLYVRPGRTEAVKNYIEEAWPGQFDLLEAAQAIEAGLFGPGSAHPGLSERVGDYILVARGEAYLWWANKENRMSGRHGGLHSEEMLVPFLAAPL